MLCTVVVPVLYAIVPLLGLVEITVTAVTVGSYIALTVTV